MKFSDVLEIKNGRNQKQVENPNGKYPIYGSGGIIGWADDYICGADTVVIGRKGTINNPIFVKTPFWNVDTAFGLCPDADKLIPKYLYYFCCNYDFEKLNTTVTIPSLTKSNLLNIEISLPTIAEQQKIIDQLDKVSALIEIRKQQISKLSELAKSRFVEMFDSGPWDTVRAGSIMFDMRNGISPSNKGSYPAKVLTLSAFTQGAFDAEAWKDGLFDSDPPKEKRVVSSDFYICRGNGNKKLVGAGVYSIKDRYDLIFPDTVIAASVDQQRVCFPYLFQAWKQPSVRKQIEQGARTTNGTYKINQGVVANIEIKLPPRELQEQFAAFVEQTDKSKFDYPKSLYKLETLKMAITRKCYE